MSKCNKVKNPCKICLAPVTQKNGLQCQGACESWVHYACLNYTPGRIKDIKAGIIKVTCPCPDCKTSYPKEFRTDEAFSCSNTQCPANRPPQCVNMKCPRNVGLETSPQMIFPNGPPCPLGSCGKDCKQHSSTPMLPQVTSGSPCNPNTMPPMPMISSSDGCIDFNKCPSGCSTTNISGDMRQNLMQNMPNMMQNMPNMMQNMPNMMGNMPNMMQNMPYNTGGSGGLPSITTIEQMANTIGLLSTQMNALMAKMRESSQGQGNPNACPGKKACPGSPQQASRKFCPKPCFCPDNPNKKY